jgi:nitroreductase
MTADSTPGYDLLYDIIRRRASVRKLKPDPIPDEYLHKILEAGRWAMSGANSQPWEYIVVKDPKVKKDLFRCYSEDNTDFIYWMEQQRVFELRHPAYQMTADEAVERQRRGAGWSEAPALIVVVGDGRRQWGTVQGAHTFGRDQSHLTDGLANTCTFMHLAAVQPSEGVRRPLEEIVHHDHYEQDKFMSNERVIQFLYELRGKTLQTYRQSYVGKEESKKS